MRIYKYKLPASETRLQIGPSSRILGAGVQHDEIVIWAIVDPNEPIDGGIPVRCINTGTEVDPETHRYINTVMVISSGIVWHVFEVL